jgi:CRISPR-associated protein Cas2
MSVFSEIIVCYDIENDKHRRIFAGKLKNFGLTRIQRSVFWGFVTKAEKASILKLFKSELDESDKAFIVDSQLSKTFERNSFNYQKSDFPPLTSYETI